MKKLASEAEQVALAAYVNELPLAEAQRAALLAACADAPDPWAALHAALAEQATASGLAPVEVLDAEAPAAARSAAARLALGLPETVPPAQALDDDTGVRWSSGPPLHRTSMVPEPWVTNPLVRGWRRLRGDWKPKPVDGPMHTQDEDAWRRAGRWRRLVLLVLVIGQTYFATGTMRQVLPYQGSNLLEMAILALFALLFAWVSSGFWTALMGFWQLLRGGDRFGVSAKSAGQDPIEKTCRTALVMPICNEDVARVFAGLRATCDSLAKMPDADQFDIFILSDSYNPDIAAAEQRAWAELRASTPLGARVFYRRRRRRVKRKSGNIDDFCRRWGADYRYMVVLDADSVMTGDCLVQLVRLMERHPQAGIIQTAPQAAGMDSVYARIQQFATRVYGPLFTAGLHFWQLGESHYWGHNAILRLEPFMKHCALAPLPGKGAFAGAILSHDFVEAALMRRAGWGVWIAYDLPGSYEELPPNLLDELQRDQRWCHGNLMNFRLFFTDGLHPVHRAVFLTGVMSYLSAPLWALFLALSTALLAVHTLTEPQYFVQPWQLFPIWPRWNPEKAIALFSTTAVLLFLPKVLGALLVAIQNPKAYGGRLRLMVSLVGEVLFSMLLAPVRMLFHTRFILAAFLGRNAQWKSPARDNNQTGWGEALLRHGTQTLLGVAWGGLVYWLDPVFLWWLSPILVSLALIVPVSVLSSRVRVGERLREKGYFLIPEEFDMPPELRQTQDEHQRLAARGMPDWMSTVRDPVWNALACALGTARHQPHAVHDAARKHQVAIALHGGPEGLKPLARLALLNDPVALTELHDALWRQRPAQWPLLQTGASSRDAKP